MKLEYGVNIAGTETFRFAMNKNPFGKGCNGQTLPKSLRYYLVPPPGRIFACGDLSQAEARVVAYLARCKDIIELFNDSTRHVHKENAIVVFGHEVEKDSPEYVLAKQVIHASNYRMGAYRFAVHTGLDVATCKQLLNNYHAKRPEIRKWHDWVWNEIRERGFLTTPLGDKRVFYEAIAAFSSQGKMLDTHWKDTIAWCPQTTVPHVTNIGIIETAKEVNGQDSVTWPEQTEWPNLKHFAWWHHQGHDSFLASIPEGSEQEFAKVVQKKFAVPLLINGMEFTIPMELGFGYNFGDFHPDDGSIVTRSKWDDWLNAKLAKKPREADILRGIYGTHLKDW